MSIQSSFPKVADQIVNFNKNIVDILSKINSLATTTESSVDVQIFDEEGILRSYTVPSFTSLKGEIERLNNNINSLYGIDADGSLIQTTSSNKFKKIITVDLNREPSAVNTLGEIVDFRSKTNWFFDSLVDPMLQVEINLQGKVENNVRKCQVRRYIIEFARNIDGILTPLGQSALNSFNDQFRGNPNVLLSEFQNWHTTSPGVVEPLNPRMDEDVFDLEPNSLLYDGEFSVLRIQEDRLNKKLFYVLNTLDYIRTDGGQVQQLNIGAEIIVNSERTSTRYKVIEVSTAQSNPRVRFERVEGIEPIPVGIGTIKIYSPVIYTKRLRISIGYNERNIIFVKPINAESNLVAKKWSLGTGFFTNDLRLGSESDDNGLTMEQYYTEYVFDYGEILKDLVAKKIPNKLAGVPVSTDLNLDNFKVVQINKHLTDTPDSNLIKTKHNNQLNLKSEVRQINEAIQDRSKRLKITKFKSEAEKRKSSLELNDLILKKESKSKLLSTISQEIIDISKNPSTNVDPKFRLRGFWKIPEAIVTRGTQPQEIVQFRVEYRYLSKDGRQNPVEQFGIEGENASYSNWVEFKTDARKRQYDSSTGEYFWQLEDLEDADTPNINQLDIPIQQGERVEIRVKSISEVGWPESPVESDWSDTISVEFPDDLNNVLNENEFILREATKEEFLVAMDNELAARGIDEHISDQITVDSRVFHHESNKILSGFKDENGVAIDLFQYLKNLEDKVKSLEERIRRAKGELKVLIYRNNQEFEVKNGSETIFNIDCEDYLEPYTAPRAPTGRVYENSVYVIKDFIIRLENSANDSPLGLLSGRTYLQNPDVYNQGAPQSFWVNDQDELITSDVSGQTRTQLNNQFLWMVNYDSVTQNTVAKLSENIGNNFTSNNSIAGVLGSTEYNIGYNETSILSLVGNNKSLLDPSKWIDTRVSVASTTKLLTTIHPVVKDLESIVENNTNKVKIIETNKNSFITIPLNIYFKMNALDNNQNGLNYEYVQLNNSKNTVQHIKKVKFLLENESENRPFTFSIRFNMNRNKVILRKTNSPINSLIR